MAVFNFDVSQLSKKLNDIINADEVSDELLNVGAKELEKYVVGAASSHIESGDMVASIGISKVSRKKEVPYISVRPTGTDSDGKRNMEKLAHLEYGYTKKDGKMQSPRPILVPAINASEKSVENAMLKKFEELVGG